MLHQATIWFISKTDYIISGHFLKRKIIRRGVRVHIATQNVVLTI